MVHILIPYIKQKEVEIGGGPGHLGHGRKETELSGSLEDAVWLVWKPEGGARLQRADAHGCCIVRGFTLPSNFQKSTVLLTFEC